MRQEKELIIMHRETVLTRKTGYISVIGISHREFLEGMSARHMDKFMVTVKLS